MNLKAFWNRIVEMLVSEEQRDLGDYLQGPVRPNVVMQPDAEFDSAAAVDQAHEQVAERP